MSKVSFRARQIDFNKPLPILRHNSEFLAEITENALVSRGVPTVPSGMEKEEENEHHFVEVLQALQTKKAASEVYIPVPEIVEDRQRYCQLYPKGFNLPSQFIHIRTAVLANDDPIEYDMDSEDEEWLRKSDLDISRDKFEAMIYKLERGCGQRVMNLEEAKYLLQDEQSLVIAIYDFWLTKRVQCRQPLVLNVRSEKRENMSNQHAATDPYIAFRRRTERMQTRKNRKNDENAYEKMLILREQMEQLDEILISLVRRESVKEALIVKEKGIFDLRSRLQDYDGLFQMEAENSVGRFLHPGAAGLIHQESGNTPRKRSAHQKKRKMLHHEPSYLHDTLKTSTSFAMMSSPENEEEEEELSEEEQDDQPFKFVRLPGCKYQKPLSRFSTRGLYDSEEETGIGSAYTTVVPAPASSLRNVGYANRYQLTSLGSICHPVRHVSTGYMRKRLGRGGRIIYDRMQIPQLPVSYFDSFDQELACYIKENNDKSLPWHLNLPMYRFMERVKRTGIRHPFLSAAVSPDLSEEGQDDHTNPLDKILIKSKFDDRPPQPPVQPATTTEEPPKPTAILMNGSSSSSNNNNNNNSNNTKGLMGPPKGGAVKRLSTTTTVLNGISSGVKRVASSVGSGVMKNRLHVPNGKITSKGGGGSASNMATAGSSQTEPSSAC